MRPYSTPAATLENSNSEFDETGSCDGPKIRRDCKID
jgi:hypothetical protein